MPTEEAKDDTTAASPPPPPPVSPPPAPVAVKPERPAELTAEYDGFWDAEKGFKLNEALTELKTHRTAKAEADVRARGIPETPEGYKLEFSPDFKLPDGSKLAIDEKHPLAGPARAFAKEVGLTQEQFSKLVTVQGHAEIANEQMLNDIKAGERKKLGANAQERVDGLALAVEGRIGKEKAEQLFPLMFTAGAVEALESLLRSAGIKYEPVKTGAREAKSADYGSLTGPERFMDRSGWKKHAVGEPRQAG